MIHVRVAVGVSINNVVENEYNDRKKVSGMVEFDQIKATLSNYEQPLLEMGDSL